MAKTPFRNLGSEEILSAHLNGIQSAVNHLEEILDLKTASKSDVPLTPYVDMVEKAARYRIYEAPDHNWLYDPAPVIKRNGLIVDPSEYQLQAEYGAIVFYVQQNETDEITADYTHIIPQSITMDQIEARLLALEQGGGGGGDHWYLQLVKHYPGTYRSHGISPQNTASNVLVLANSIDIFPFKAYETIICDQMGAHVSTADAGALTSFAIYTDNQGYPGDLIAQTGTVDCSSIGWKEEAFTSGDITLNAGDYWIARFSNSGIAFNGLEPTAIYPVPSAPPLGSSTINNNNGLGAGVGGIRYATPFDSGEFPASFPPIGAGPEYFDRNAYASPWIRRKP